MFNVINLETGEPIEEVSATGRDAAAKAARLTEETGIKHQPRKIIEDNKWEARERARLLDETYKPLPISITDIGLLYRRYPTHFLHMSDQPPMIAFTKDAQMGVADRQTRMFIRQYFERYFPDSEEYSPGSDSLPGSLKQHIIDRVESIVIPEVKFAKTSKEIVDVYTNYDCDCAQVAQSCMRYNFDKLPCHPTSVYGAGDLAIAYLTNENGQTTHRTVCWPEKKLYSRMYAPDDKLHVALKSLGYCKSRYYNCGSGPSFDGAKLLIIELSHRDDVYVMPYVDEPLAVERQGNHFVLANCSNDYSTSETNGTTLACEEDDEDEQSFYCEHCEESSSDNTLSAVYTCQRGIHAHGIQYWCEDCRELDSFHCDATGADYSDDVDSFNMANGETWSEGYFDENGGKCDHTCDYVPAFELEEVTCTDGSTEMWCQSARDNEAIYENDIWRERGPHPDQQQFAFEESIPCS